MCHGANSAAEGFSLLDTSEAEIGFRSSFLWRKKEDSLKGSAIILQDNNTIIKITLHSPFSFQIWETIIERITNARTLFFSPPEESHK